MQWKILHVWLFFGWMLRKICLSCKTLTWLLSLLLFIVKNFIWTNFFNFRSHICIAKNQNKVYLHFDHLFINIWWRKSCLKLKIEAYSETKAYTKAYSELSRTSKMNRFVKKVNRSHPFTIFTRHFIVDVLDTPLMCHLEWNICHSNKRQIQSFASFRDKHRKGKKSPNCSL